MPKVWVMQSNMNQGELDPRLLGRTDIAIYYNALRKARNVTPLIQGGMSRRGGFEHIDTITAPTRVESFRFNDGEQYLIAFVRTAPDNFILIYDAFGALLDTLLFTGEIESDFDFVQSADTAIIVQEQVPPDHQP